MKASVLFLAITFTPMALPTLAYELMALDGNPIKSDCLAQRETRTFNSGALIASRRAGPADGTAEGGFALMSGGTAERMTKNLSGKGDEGERVREREREREREFENFKSLFLHYIISLYSHN